MKLPAFKIIKTISEKRELTLGEVNQMLFHKFNDHRDFYPIATLYTAGYIDTNTNNRKSDLGANSKNEEVARLFHAMTFGKGEFAYENRGYINDVDFNKELKFSCTAKTDLFFTEMKAKRKDRIITIAIGILIAIISSALTNLFRTLF